MRKAYSYARFSSAKQAEGFSLARQLDAAKSYCARNGLTLDDRTFTDLGVSGYTGRNATTGDLAVFLDLVREGRIDKGSVLIVENTDRLSRLPPNEANRIITTVVRAGVDIVTTSPEQIYTAANIDKLATWLPLQVSNCLAHEESVKKSDRLKDPWARKRSDVAAGKKFGARCPFWLAVNADRTGHTIRPREADLVRRMYLWSAEGLGVMKICERLQTEYPAGITGKGWLPMNVTKILRNRAVLGELQPHVRDRTVPNGRRKLGEPVGDYYPAILSAADFYRTQAALDTRKRGGGRITGTPNLFNGLLYDDRDDQRMVIAGTKTTRGDGAARVLVSGGALKHMKGSVYITFPYAATEAAILSQLVELTAKDVAGAAPPAADEVATLSGRLSDVNRKVDQVRARAAAADDPGVYFEIIDTLTKERKDVIAALERAKSRADVRGADTLGACVSLVHLLDGAADAERDDLRRRTKAALGRLVEKIRMRVVRTGRDRLALMTVWFRAGGVRAVVALWCPGKKVDGRITPGRLHVRSGAHDHDRHWTTNGNTADPEHVAALRQYVTTGTA